MKLRALFWSFLLVLVSHAAAQQPPARTGKPDDAAALDEAIRAVDRAKEKADPAKNGETTPATDSSTPPKPNQPAKPAATTPGGSSPAPKSSANERPDGTPAKAKPKSVAAPQTQITALEDTELDNARNLIIWRKNVVVDRPDLKIWCDRLEIALNRAQPKAGAAPAKPEKPEKSDKEPDAFGSESIKTATATAGDGGLVVIWRKTETGDVVAVGRKAIYTAGNGAFTITGLPEVLKDMTLHLHSPGESDKLTLFKNGSAQGMKTTDLNLSAVRAKEIRQRLFSHVPGRRPPEAAAPGEAGPAPSAGKPEPPATLPPLPPKSTPGN